MEQIKKSSNNGENLNKRPKSIIGFLIASIIFLIVSVFGISLVIDFCVNVESTGGLGEGIGLALTIIFGLMIFGLPGSILTTLFSSIGLRICLKFYDKNGDNRLKKWDVVFFSIILSVSIVILGACIYFMFDFLLV